MKIKPRIYKKNGQWICRSFKKIWWLMMMDEGKGRTPFHAYSNWIMRVSI